MKRSLVLALAAAIATACGSSGGASVADAVSTHAVDPGNAGGNKLLTVMTRNLYVGGDLFLPFTAPDPLLAASTVWGDILASDPAARMAAIAAELCAARPDLVALEEAYHFTVTPLGAAAPVLLDLDYLAFLEDALAACPGSPADEDRRDGCDGPRLRIAAVQPHTVITVPFPAEGIQITMTDRDAILADADVQLRSRGGGDFEAEYLATLAGTIPVHLKRGWVEVAARHQGVPFTFVATHLETKDFGPLQSFQAMELLGRFGADEPVIVAGDTNSDPDDPAYVVPGAAPIPTPYQLFATAFRDAASGVGDTCCFAADLRPPSALYERVDLILSRGAISARSAARTGLDPLASLGDRWPSDHAGVVATLRLENPKFFALK